MLCYQGPAGQEQVMRVFPMSMRFGSIDLEEPGEWLLKVMDFETRAIEELEMSKVSFFSPQVAA